ncbi:MAG: PHB depolymerase family esterase, partial [Verrucomicrobiota bacterium]
TRKFPVVIAFHGGGGNPESMVRISRLNEKSEESGFLVVYPYGSGPDPDRMLTFNGGECCGYAMHQEIDEIGYVNAILDDLVASASVDTGAVFATGLSNGAIMAYRIAAELSERIAAIAPVGGPLMMDSISPTSPVAVMHFHGTADKFAPFEGGYGINSQGAKGVTDFRSVEYSLETWIKANGCSETPTIKSLPNPVEDDMTATQKTWDSGERGVEVVLIEIKGGGHTWPGVSPPPAAAFLGASTQDFSANDLMWEFFQKHRRTVDEHGGISN